jgi:hypothetical protein
LAHSDICGIFAGSNLEDKEMKTKAEILERLRQSIAKKKAWIEESDEELLRIYSERHGTTVAVS